MNQTEQMMREALREFIAVMDNCCDYPDTSGERESLRHVKRQAEQILAAEPAKLVRLTGEELSEIAGRVNKTWLANSPRSDIVPLLAAAISGALEAKNGGR